MAAIADYAPQLRALAGNAQVQAEMSRSVPTTMYYNGIEDVLRWLAGDVSPTVLLRPVVAQKNGANL